MANIFNNITGKIRSMFGGDNKFNEAFLFGVGDGYTQYDPINRLYIEKGYNINPIVYSVINQQATKTASIPYYIKKVDDSQSVQKLKRLRRAGNYDLTAQQKVRAAFLEHKAYDKEDMPFPMERPNTTQTWAEFIALYKTFMKTTGNAYIYMLAPEDGSKKGEPLQVYLLPSHLMQIVLKPNATMIGIESPIQGYILSYGRSFIEFESNNVIHIKYSNPNYGQSGEHLYGMSPLRSALKNIESSNVALDLNIKTLKSGGAFGFIHGKTMALTPDQASEIKGRLQEMNNNPEDLAKIAGISAEIGFTRLSLTSDELKPFDYLSFDTKSICNVLGWSTILLNDDSNSTYDNINSERKRVITDNIIPDLELLSDALNDYFLPRFKGYENTEIVFDAMELPEMQQDIKELSEWLNNALDRGVLTRNEYRTAINYLKSDDKNMDEFTVQNDIMSLDEAMDNTFGING